MYKEPWKDGNNKAYPIADTVEDIWVGVKRKRKSLTVLLSHSGCKGINCISCGFPLDDFYPIYPGDKPNTKDSGYAYVDVYPRKKIAYPRHYYCAWANTMNLVLEVGKALRG
jgi:hypothetical protein